MHIFIVRYHNESVDMFFLLFSELDHFMLAVSMLTPTAKALLVLFCHLNCIQLCPHIMLSLWHWQCS